MMSEQERQVVVPTHLQLASDMAPFDRRLIDMLQVDGRRPYSSIARELRTTEKTVRRRMLALRDEGYLRITTVLDPRLLGFEAMGLVGVNLDGSRTSSEIIAAVATMTEVDYVSTTTGRFDLWIELVCRDKTRLLEILERHIRRLEGVAYAELFPYLSLYYQRPQFAGVPTGFGHPVSATRLTIDELDRKILAELALDGRSSYLAIGRKLGSSESRVRKRVKRMVTAGAVQIMAIVNPQSLGYRTMAWLALTVAPGARLMVIADAFARLHAVTYVAVCAGRYDLFVEVAFRDDEELLTALDEQVRVVPGLASVEVFPYVSLTYKQLLSAG